MRTTVNIDDGLLETVKRRAQTKGKTLGDVIEAALQRYLAVPDGSAADAPELPVLHTGGLLPGIDPTSNASLLEAAGDKHEEFARRAKAPAS